VKGGTCYGERPYGSNAVGSSIGMAAMVTQTDLFNRLLGTVPITAPQFRLAFAAAVLLVALWEIGKLVVRRRASRIAAVPAAN
jgi:hypothetical protein